MDSVWEQSTLVKKSRQPESEAAAHITPTAGETESTDDGYIHLIYPISYSPGPQPREWWNPEGAGLLTSVILIKEISDNHGLSQVILQPVMSTTEAMTDWCLSLISSLL